MQNNGNKIIQTHLFVGNEDALNKAIISRLQAHFCQEKPTSSSCFCSQCRKIKQAQHPSVLWLSPSNSYHLEDLKIVFDTIRLLLDNDQAFFFILDKTQLLTPVCANKLLKTLEEPPHGYYFFLLANNEQHILPTIKSRCHIHRISTQAPSLFLHPLLTFFVDPDKQHDAILFEQELKKHKPTEQETVELLSYLVDTMRQRIISYHKNCHTNRDIEQLEKDKRYKTLRTNLQFLEKELLTPPPPGSATLFWKKMFLLKNC